MLTLKPVNNTTMVPTVGHHSHLNSNDDRDIESQGLYQDGLKANAAKLKEYLESVQRDLEIEINAESNRVIVKVIQKKTGKIIRQIPSEDLLQLGNSIEKAVGLLFEDSF